VKPRWAPATMSSHPTHCMANFKSNLSHGCLQTFPPLIRWVSGRRVRCGPVARSVHGKLAWGARLQGRAATAFERFPPSYTIRSCGDHASRNGSSSMASVCGGSLSDDGCRTFPLKAPVCRCRDGPDSGRRRLVCDPVRHSGANEDHLGDMGFFKWRVQRTGLHQFLQNGNIKTRAIKRPKIMEKAPGASPAKDRPYPYSGR